MDESQNHFANINVTLLSDEHPDSLTLNDLDNNFQLEILLNKEFTTV